MKWNLKASFIVFFGIFLTTIVMAIINDKLMLSYKYVTYDIALEIATALMYISFAILAITAIVTLIKKITKKE